MKVEFIHKSGRDFIIDIDGMVFRTSVTVDGRLEPIHRVNDVIEQVMKEFQPIIRMKLKQHLNEVVSATTTT